MLAEISMSESPLGRYIEKINPDLSNEVGHMDKYDAVCKICDFYGVRSPEEGDLIAPSVQRILDEIREKQQVKSNKCSQSDQHG